MSDRRPRRTAWRPIAWAAIVCILATAAQSAAPATAPTSRDTAQIDPGDKRTDRARLPADLTFRARVTAIAPERPVQINWRYGGEALGGAVFRGTLGANLPLGHWTQATPLADLVKGPWPPAYQARYWYLTFTVNDAKSRGLCMEFEFAYRGRVLKTFTADAPDGVTVGLVVPHYRLAGGVTPDHPDFVAELTGLREYAQRRADAVARLPHAAGARPSKLLIATDLGGYGPGAGYGVRHADKAIVEIELGVLRAMGVNTLRTGPAYLRDLARRREGPAAALAAGELGGAMGFPVPAFRAGRANDPEAGCPFAAGVPRRTEEAVKAALVSNLGIPTPEVWALTVDEIGTVFDHAPEGKKHMETCPQCIDAFRAYARDLGATPADFGQPDWSTVKPLYAGGPRATTYYARRFNNYATARLFTPLAKAFDAENANKRAALARGEKAGPATQPWLHSFALRGNTFLMGGHSLDFFDFYRHADNAFVYETSNRAWQVWQWDSYLCDVGRVLTREMDKPFGIYVKPHRGAPVQRALSAVARGARMLYWYTYGPDYYKGDSYCDTLDTLALTVKAAQLLGRTEDVLVGAAWVHRPEVAIVKPRASEFLGNDAQWENAKWVYTALAHAHIPVDPIDEVMLAQSDLSRYKAIYVNGSHLPRKSAEALARYVENGGLLWTSGHGLARDEADEPLKALEPVLGLASRADPELWYKVQRYGGGGVQPFTDARAALAPVPPGAKIAGDGPYAGAFSPLIGREPLKPMEGTRTLARFADGSAAMTEHPYGKGRAIVVGFYPGLEYSASLRDGAPDMTRDLDPARRAFITAPALAVTTPPVEPSVPAVEAVLVRNAATGKRAIVLMNWAYKLPTPAAGGRAVAQVVELTNVEITIRGAADVTKARSALLDRELPLRRDGDALRITLPQLTEGDVLLLD